MIVNEEAQKKCIFFKHESYGVYLFLYLPCVLRPTQRYFMYTTAAIAIWLKEYAQCPDDTNDHPQVGDDLSLFSRRRTQLKLDKLTTPRSWHCGWAL